MHARAKLSDRGARSLLWREIEAHPSRFSSVTPLHIRNNPMLLLAACFAGGVLCRPLWQPPAQMVLACAMLLAAAAVARVRAPRLAWPATAIAWIALGWMAASLQPGTQDKSLLPYADELQRTVEGRVVVARALPQRRVAAEDDRDIHEVAEDPSTDVAGRVATEVLELQATAIEDVSPDLSRMTPITGGVLVTLVKRGNGPDVDVPCGAHIRVTVRLHPPHRYRDPGVWSYADALEARGISVESTADPATIHVIDTTKVPLPCRFAAAQRWASQRLTRLTGSPLLAHMPHAFRLSTADTSMLAAMLFGDRTQLQRSARTAFERTGSFHLFVVAGVHVALLMGALFFLLQRLRVSRWMAGALAIVLTSGYAFMTGFGAPVQRALLMSSVYLLMRLMGRERHALNALGAAALAMLMLRPDALLESSFQMTLLAVFGIAGIAVPLAERTVAPYARALRDIGSVRTDPYLRPRLAQLRVSMRWLGRSLAPRNVPRTQTTWLQRAPSLGLRGLLALCELLFITLIAEIVMALPMAVYFHRVTPFAAPANLLALPMVGVLMASAIATFVASLLGPAAALIPAAVTALLLHAVTFIIGTLSSLRGADIRIPSPLFPLALAAVALWFLSAWLLRTSSVRFGRIACVLAPLGLVIALWPRTPQVHRDLLEFTAIDVGQGDSLLTVSPQARTMLIDAGGPIGPIAADPNAFDVGEEVVSPYLWSRGLRRLDVLVLTHAHSDHIGGMAAVLRNFHPHELWLSVDHDASQYQALLREARLDDVVVKHLNGGDSFDWGGTQIRIVSPSRTYQPGAAPANDDSLVLRVGYGRASLLAAGDAEAASEATMLSNSVQPVTLLKVGHHGSSTSTSSAFLQALHPSTAVISCGLGNRFGHPRMPVLQRLQAAGVSTARTDDMGAVQYLLHSDGRIETHVLASNP